MIDFKDLWFFLQKSILLIFQNNQLSDLSE